MFCTSVWNPNLYPLHHKKTSNRLFLPSPRMPLSESPFRVGLDASKTIRQGIDRDDPFHTALHGMELLTMLDDKPFCRSARSPHIPYSKAYVRMQLLRPCLYCSLQDVLIVTSSVQLSALCSCMLSRIDISHIYSWSHFLRAQLGWWVAIFVGCLLVLDEQI